MPPQKPLITPPPPPPAQPYTPSNPDLAAWLSKPLAPATPPPDASNSVLSRIIRDVVNLPNAVRFGGPMAGAMTGAELGSALGPGGTVGGLILGGLIGGLGGEAGAEKLAGEELNPGRILASGAIGAIPLGTNPIMRAGMLPLTAGKAALKEGAEQAAAGGMKSALGRYATRAAIGAGQGAFLGAGGTTVESLVNRGELPSADELGGAVEQGGASGALMNLLLGSRLGQRGQEAVVGGIRKAIPPLRQRTAEVAGLPPARTPIGSTEPMPREDFLNAFTEGRGVSETPSTVTIPPEALVTPPTVAPAATGWIKSTTPGWTQIPGEVPNLPSERTGLPMPPKPLETHPMSALERARLAAQDQEQQIMEDLWKAMNPQAAAPAPPAPAAPPPPPAVPKTTVTARPGRKGLSPSGAPPPKEVADIAKAAADAEAEAKTATAARGVAATETGKSQEGPKKKAPRPSKRPPAKS